MGIVSLCSRSSRRWKCKFVYQGEPKRCFDQANQYEQVYLEYIFLWPNRDINNMKMAKQKG